MTDVCHIITRMILGGAQENTLLTVRGLHEDPDYNVKLVTGPAEGPEGELLENARSFGIEPVLIPELKRNINPYYDMIAFVKLYRYLNEQSFDIVHTHSSKAGILGRWAAYFNRVPWILHTIHGLPFHEYQSRWRYWTFRGLEAATASVTDLIQTVCDRMAEKAQAAGIHPDRGFKTVYSGMELEPFLEVPELNSNEALNRKADLGYTEDHFVFGKIARLFNLKGHKYCLKAFARVVEKHPHARLMLVGNGILKDDLVDQCQSLGIRDKVQFTGLVPYRKIPDMLAAMDALVHTSLREGLARVLPQAQAAGRPVISYDIDGAPEAIEHGETGFLVPPRSIDELSERMIDLIENPEWRESMVEAARDWVQPRYEWRHMVEEIKQSYRNLLDGKP
ncbi:MAG: glycosyltransferase family 4 protein [bacterium]